MKKILIGLTIALSFLGISRVNAETLNFTHSDTYQDGSYYEVSDYGYLKKIGVLEYVEEIYNLLIDSYKSSYSSYLYYSYSLHYEPEVNIIYGYLSLYNNIPSYVYDINFPGISSDISISTPDLILRSSYDFSKYILPEVYSYISPRHVFDDYFLSYNPLFYFISNFDLINNTDYTFVVTGNSNFTINPGDVITPIFTNESPFQNNYTEINLNDYAYVALSLKDYNQDAFETTVQVKGQYCITPVYNYGMTERKDILTGTQVERCSPYYDNYTPIRTYILDNDLKNNSIYYLKAYDISKDNYVKIDTSIFDVTLITEEEKDNPYVTINGKTYPTIPYDELTDTATKSEDEGYVSGAVEEFSFADIFTAPLEFLKDVWSSIVNVFDLIIEFIHLLPKEVQGFLISSFYLAVAIGLLKVLI